ncbi:ABC transporter substrate-binding protein [Solicola gregarius]|uniref:ABC transporter substrate-binding protein n=1 Tax=Solicola gregarius TaxID=2908642 RepID=A0AA46THI5_9ACTN|nr:ABC transporter substrate-binding protein [Solicola gregarius]UYM05271.1 ABC transporter substrate-binding protein [Solicola gregarius]
MNRLNVVLTALLAVVLMTTTACGDDDPAGAETSAANAAPAEEGAFPVEIEHKYGTTTVEEEPERVVVVGLKEQDDLLALGVVPVATTEWLDDTPGGLYPWAKERLVGADVPASLNQDDGVQFEKVAAQRPDLIIGLYSGLTQADYDKLSQIAPTVAQPGDIPDYGIGWQEELLTVGKAVGRPEAAQEIVDDVEGKIEDVAKKHPEFQGKHAIFATPYEGTYVYGSADPRSRLLTDIGFELPSDIDDVVGTKDFGANISAENTEFVDTDALVWLTNVMEDKDAILDNEVYTSLPVHEEGRDVFVGDAKHPDYGFSISFVTALSVPYTLDRLVPQLAAAVDGDPATKVPTPKD